ncbi:MAG: phage protein GemA/Gp16 family protein [Methylophilus sp.]
MSDLVKHYRQLLGIAKTWATANLAGWCDETHRDLLARHGAVQVEGRISASSMNMPQLAAALEDYERRGWPKIKKFNARGEAAREVPPRIANIFKLWGKLGMAGKIESATRQSLLKFCSRQVKRQVNDLDALSVQECQHITEALKSWYAR